MGGLVMMSVCILVLDIHDLCALLAHSAHVLTWAVPGSIVSFASLVMISLQRNALVDSYDHRLGPIRCCSSQRGPGPFERGNKIIQKPPEPGNLLDDMFFEA